VSRTTSGARFALTMAWREARGSRRTLALLVLAIAIGVAALVAIRSFADDVRDSIRVQARALLGADLVAGSAQPFSVRAESELRALTSDADARVARIVSFGAMARVVGHDGSRLVQVVAVERGYPFYGEVRTEPPLAWPGLADGRHALADEALLPLIGASPGDALAIGGARFVIQGVVHNMPGDVGVRTSLGPRVFIPASALPATGLLGLGSRVRYEAFVRLPDRASAASLIERHRPSLAAERVTLRTVADDQRRLNETLSRLTRYLGLVGLIAVLLGGIGVASATHVLMRRRLSTIAVLRCLGATSRRIFAVYLTQALLVGLAGSATGAVAGVAIEALLPRAVRGLLPFPVDATPSPLALLVGLATGASTAVLFALLPILEARRVPPLRALRRDVEATPSLKERWLAALAVGLGVFGLSALQAESLVSGIAFTLGILVALLVLLAAAVAIRAALRRLVARQLPYVWRQGLSNLHRPANQTLAVCLALGFGTFLLATLVVLQHNLLRDLRVDVGPRPNLALFDIQPDQKEAVLAELRARGAEPSPPVPIVPMRIASLKGVSATQKLAQAAASAPTEGPLWLLRREFRSTYRNQKADSETIVAGAWWQAGAGAASPVPVSLERDVARQLGVTVGDAIVWDVQGVAVPSRVASVREVEWARFEPNFFAVFPEGPLDDAPQMFVTLGRLPEPADRARLVRAVSERFPNVSALDLADVQRAIEDVLARVAWAVRFLALFSVATGALVLLGAVATSRFERLREATLLKALGATRRQVMAVVLSEYAALGLVSATTGILLAVAGGFCLTRFVFETGFSLPLASLLAFAAAVTLTAVGLGLSGSLSVFRRPALELLREE